MFLQGSFLRRLPDLVLFRVIFKNTKLSNYALNPALWSQWSSSSPQTDHVFYADYNTQGTYSRPSFAKQLDANTAAQYNIGSALGSNYASWVDTSYL
jgi:pectinesterase